MEESNPTNFAGSADDDDDDDDDDEGALWTELTDSRDKLTAILNHNTHLLSLPQLVSKDRYRPLTTCYIAHFPHINTI